MAKELPYFKFNASEWISGAITLEDLTTQGAFINICSYYWFKSGCLTLTEIKRRLKLKQATLDALINGNHIKVDGDQVQISFLKEQFDERGMISERNSKNGSKGGAPIGNKNAQKNNREQAKTTNIEEEKNKNKKREEESENAREVFLVKDFEWFKKQIDEIWFDQLPSEKKENVPRALQEAWAHLSADELRLHNAGSKECKQLLNTWLSRMKSENTNGTLKIINDKLKSDALIKQKYAAKAAAGGGNAN